MKWLFKLCVLLAFFWFAGLIGFITLIPTKAADDNLPADAIVVLTGGSLRLDRGFELLAQGKARKMFISGVEDGLSLASLLRSRDYRAFEGRIDPGSVTLGHQARTTIGNAEETAQWVAREQVRTIRLVTGNYHIPRSLYELHAVMPDMRIIPDPVFPSHFAHNQWWQYAGNIRLVISEYHKYIASILAHRLLVNSW